MVTITTTITTPPFPTHSRTSEACRTPCSNTSCRQFLSRRRSYVRKLSSKGGVVSSFYLQSKSLSAVSFKEAELCPQIIVKRRSCELILFTKQKFVGSFFQGGGVMSADYRQRGGCQMSLSRRRSCFNNKFFKYFSLLLFCIRVEQSVHRIVSFISSLNADITLIPSSL
jgi:hypothetical protein